MGDTLYTIFCYLVLFAICGAILAFVYGQVAETEKEIAEEECEKKYRRKIKRLEDEAKRPVIGIKDLDGEEFTLQKTRASENVIVDVKGGYDKLHD